MVISFLLLTTIALTAVCGMSMSGHAVPFAFFDYEKAGWLVFLENLLMLTFWAFTGTHTALICRLTDSGPGAFSEAVLFYMMIAGWDAG